MIYKLFSSWGPKHVPTCKDFAYRHLCVPKTYGIAEPHTHTHTHTHTHYTLYIRIYTHKKWC